MAIGPRLADLAKRSPLTGVGSVAANLTTHGGQSVAMRDNLAGTVQLRLRDGAIPRRRRRACAARPEAGDTGRQGHGGPTDVPADTARLRPHSCQGMDADLALAAGVATIKRPGCPIRRSSVSASARPAIIDLPKGTVDVMANVKLAEPPYADLRGSPARRGRARAGGG